MKSSPERRAIAALLLVIATAGLLAFAGVRVLADGAPKWGADYFPNVVLTTHQGKSVRFFDDLIKGRIVAIDLIYTTCQYACPLETARLAQVQRALGERMGRDVFFYSITIDPDHDTPAVLDAYARKYNVGPGWLFLTGAKADIDLLSRKLGLYSPRSRVSAGTFAYDGAAFLAVCQLFSQSPIVRARNFGLSSAELRIHCPVDSLPTISIGVWPSGFDGFGSE